MRPEYYDASHTYLPGIGLRHAEPDAHGREMGFDETASSDAQVLRTVGYSWDTAGRMDTVTDEEEIHEYAYYPNSSLIATIDSQDDQTATWFRESRLYDVSGRLVATRSDRVSGQTESPLTRYAYRLDDLNRRERATLLDGSKWDYGYNPRSEVETATRKNPAGTEIPALGSGYTYDGLGNRLTSTSPVLGNLTYTPNQLNQFASISTDSTATRTAVGRAPAGDVTVNSATASRIGEIYYRQLTADNSSGPVWQAVNTNWSTASVERHFWYPAATTDPEDYPLRYDWDGNLETDGRWSYTWDAENRLVQMETTEIAESAGHPYRKLRYAYDWQGRRIARTVWHGTRSTPTIASSQRWLYDGWNPVTEFTATAEFGVTPSRSITLTWGIDLSGSLRGAGGVGGLLACRKLADSPATTHRPCFDGNGNVVGWLKHGDSSLEARRECDPFGNPLVEEVTEPVAIGFSTKMRDDETGLLYYGRRWYIPPTGRWMSRDPIEENGGLNLHGFLRNDGINQVDALGTDALGEEIRRIWLDRLRILVAIPWPFSDLINSHPVYELYDSESFIAAQREVQPRLDSYYESLCSRKHPADCSWQKIDVNKGDKLRLFLEYPGVKPSSAKFWLGTNNPYTEVISGSFECCLCRNPTRMSIRNIHVNYLWYDEIDAQWRKSLREDAVKYLEFWRAIEFGVRVGFMDDR